MKFTTTKSNSDTAQNYSLHFRNQKEENLAWKNPIRATRKFVLSMSHVDMASRKVVQTISAVFPNRSSFFQEDSFLRAKGSWLVFPPILRTEELFVYRSPKWLQVWYVFTIKKNENLMDHIIGTLYGQYCWRRLENMEHKISQKNQIQLIKEGSSQKRFEICVDHKNSLACFRAIQGHSGSIPKMPELMGHTSISYNWKEYIFSSGCSWSAQSILEIRFRVEKKATKHGNRSSLHL